MKLSRRQLFTTSPALLLHQFLHQPGTLPPPPLPTEEEQSDLLAQHTVQIQVLIWMQSVHEERIRWIEDVMINTSWWRPKKKRPT